MLKHRPFDNSNTCRPPDAFTNWIRPEAAQHTAEGTKSSGYRGMEPGERVGSVNERASHHRAVPG